MSKLHLLIGSAICLSMAILISVCVGAGEAKEPATRMVAMATADEAAQPGANLSLVSLGVVKRDGNRTFLVLDKKYAPGLVSVGDFSHIMVFYWCDRNDTPEKRAVLQFNRRNKASPLTGIFATRSPARPNPIAITTCKIIQVKDNYVEIEWIDAFDDSPIIDIKPYIPRNDSFPQAKTPVWVG
ncbi:MAG: tRNA (N6-threonylcarbamoyladenosine(37)-N6)-methyltransferase TrmO [Pirellulales bacterium]